MWECRCGATNWDDATKCHKCRKSVKDIERLIELTALAKTDGVEALLTLLLQDPDIATLVADALDEIGLATLTPLFAAAKSRGLALSEVGHSLLASATSSAINFKESLASALRTNSPEALATSITESGMDVPFRRVVWAIVESWRPEGDALGLVFHRARLKRYKDAVALEFTLPQYNGSSPI